MGSKKAMENTPTNEEIEKDIEVAEGQKIGSSPNILLYAGAQELNDYLFLEGLFFSKFKIKSFNGASLEFKSKKGNFTLPSAIQEIECEFSGKYQRFVSQISFDITKEQLKLILDKKYESVIFKIKSKSFKLERQ